MMAVLSLLSRELKRFYRQPSRVIGVFGFPLILWAIMGFGFGDQITVAGQNYLAYFFPGSILLVVLFTAIFANISVIEDRHSGFLQGVLVSPTSRSSIVLGKVLGGALLGCIQGVTLAILFWGFTQFPPVVQILQTVGSLVLIALVLSALGFVFAWRLDSVQGFHGVMNLVLMPMWILSGALFPLADTGPLRVLMRVNPLHYGLVLFRGGLGEVTSIPSNETANTLQCALVLGLFGLALLGTSIGVVRAQAGESK